MHRLFIFLLAVGLAAAHGDVPGPAADRLVAAVRAELPPGWSVACDKVNGWLTISRDQPVLLWWRPTPNAPPPGLDPAAEAEKKKPHPYSFDFHIVPKISLADYRRFDAENAEFAKQRKALREQLVKMGLRETKGKDPDQYLNEFWPPTEEGRAVLGRYKAAKGAGHLLPDFYFDDLALAWGWNSPDYPHSAPLDETIRKECERVRDKVIHVFSKYDSDEMKARPAPQL